MSLEQCVIFTIVLSFICFLFWVAKDYEEDGDE